MWVFVYFSIDFRLIANSFLPSLSISSPNSLRTSELSGCKAWVHVETHVINTTVTMKSVFNRVIVPTVEVGTTEQVLHKANPFFSFLCLSVSLYFSHWITFAKTKRPSRPTSTLALKESSADSWARRSKQRLAVSALPAERQTAAPTTVRMAMHFLGGKPGQEIDVLDFFREICRLKMSCIKSGFLEAGKECPLHSQGIKSLPE